MDDDGTDTFILYHRAMSYPEISGRPQKGENEQLHELLDDDQTQTQHELVKAINMSQETRDHALIERRPEWSRRHGKVILLHDNAPSHTAKPVKDIFKPLGYGILLHPLYSPDLAPYDYHLFSSKGHAFADRRFSNFEVAKWLDEWIWNRFLQTGSASRRPGQGRRRATTPNEDRYLLLTAQRHRNMNATLLQEHLRWATGTMVSTQTVRNRLHVVGLYARRSMVCVRLTSRHRRDRRNRDNPVFVHESVRFGGGVVLVYGGLSIDGRTDLYIIRDGPLTARRYRDEIIRPIVVPYAAAIGDDFILMDDNCRSHRANLVEDFLFEEGIVRMEWPACSPRYESNRTRLGRSRKMSCWPPTTPTNSPRTGKSSSGRVGQNTPTRD
ncbi:mariner Mos1 transposase [Trichonephila clavipes]|nr:mariner Mos1 transposase [Trichonephila clavipes]